MFGGQQGFRAIAERRAYSMEAGRWSTEPSCFSPNQAKRLPLSLRAAKARGSGQAEATWKIFLNCITRSRDLAADPPFLQTSLSAAGDSQDHIQHKQALYPSPPAPQPLLDLELCPRGRRNTGEGQMLPHGQLGAACLWSNRNLPQSAQQRQDGQVGREE